VKVHFYISVTSFYTQKRALSSPAPTFVALFHQPDYIMRHSLLVFLLFTESFQACQYSPVQAAATQASVELPSFTHKLLLPEKSATPAAEIIFKSSDGGQTWQDISAGLPQAYPVSRIMGGDTEVFLCGDGKLYHSNTATTVTDWVAEDLYDPEISGIFPSQSGMYLSSYRKGFFQKIPGVGILIPRHNALEDKTVRAIMETADGAIFVGCESGMYKSVDAGKSWKHVLEGTGINSFAQADGVLICGTYEGLHRSTDGGEHWELTEGEDGSSFRTSYVGGRFIAVTEGQKEWRDRTNHSNRLRVSSDGGKTWQRLDENLSVGMSVFKGDKNETIRNIHDIKMAGQYLFCSCDAGILRSNDWGKSWEPVFPSDGKGPLELAVSGKVIYAVRVVGC